MATERIAIAKILRYKGTLLKLDVLLISGLGKADGSEGVAGKGFFWFGS